MIRSIANAAVLCSFGFGGVASAQTACGVDNPCLIREAVISVLIKDEFQPSIAAASALTVCQLTRLKASAVAAVAAADAKAELQVRAAVTAVLTSSPADVAGPLVDRAVESVRLARQSQTLGHAAGLDAFLREYPRIKTDFCTMAERNITASLAPAAP